MRVRSALALMVVGSLASSGCTIPRTALVAGTLGTIAGGVVLSSQQEVPDCSPIPIPYGCADTVAVGVSNAATIALGAVILAVSAGVLLSGVVGLAQESDETKPADPHLALTAATASSAPLPPGSIALEIGAPAIAGSSDAAASPDVASPQLQARLAMEIRLAARANRCPSAQVLLRALARLDPDVSLALIDGDKHVRRCAQAPVMQPRT
jgi:hypothetical protein